MYTSIFRGCLASVKYCRKPSLKVVVVPGGIIRVANALPGNRLEPVFVDLTCKEPRSRLPNLTGRYNNPIYRTGPPGYINVYKYGLCCLWQFAIL